MSAYPSSPQPPFQQPPYPQPPPKRGMAGWLIALLAVVGTLFLIVPVLAVLSIYGVRKYIVNAKTTEARLTLVQIAKDASTTADLKTGFCASASSPVPVDIKLVRGTKYQSSPANWAVDERANAGFACLGFSLTTAQYYRYSYTAMPGRKGFEAIAQGDLNGDGVLSKFATGGTIDAAGTVTIAPTMLETNPAE